MREKLERVAEYFQRWDLYTADSGDKPTAECLYDLQSSIRGLIELAGLSKLPIRPAYINSDLVELHFSQVRHLFNNQTPNVLQYQSVQNSIILGQKLAFTSAKTNPGLKSYPKPMSMYKKKG